MTEATMVDIDSLLDGTLDDLADVPEFKPWPDGAHRATIKWDLKEVSGQKCPELTATAIETMELADPTNDQPLAANDSTSVLFMFKKKDGTANEIGQGQFKELIAPLVAATGAASPREAMDKANGMEVLLVSKKRADKNDKTKFYTSFTSLQVI